MNIAQVAFAAWNRIQTGSQYRTPAHSSAACIHVVAAAQRLADAGAHERAEKAIALIEDLAGAALIAAETGWKLKQLADPVADPTVTPTGCRLARIRLGWTAEYLARLAQVDTTTICYFETYKGPTTTRALRRSKTRIEVGFASAGVFFDGRGLLRTAPESAKRGHADARTGPRNVDPEKERTGPGALVRAARLDLGWTQARLATESGFASSTISKAESGISSEQVLIALERVLRDHGADPQTATP